MALPLLGPLLSAAGTALLQRTYFLQPNTATGIPLIICVLDAVTEETSTYTANVTQHTVEQGSEVSDHIQIKNPTLHIKGTISNSPLDLATSVGNLASGALDFVSSSQFRSNVLNSGIQQAAGIAGASLLGGGGLTGAANDLLAGGIGASADAIARAVLIDAFSAKTPFDVVTKRLKYESMVIEKLSFPRDQNTGYQVMFEMDLIKLRIVSSMQVQMNSVDEAVVTSALQKMNLGGQTTKQASAGTASKAGGSVITALVSAFTK